MKAKDEDSIYLFIKELIDRDKSNSFLLKYLQVEFLSEKIQNELYDTIDTFEVEVIGSLWKALKRKGAKPVLKQNPNRHEFLVYNQENKWNGIFEVLKYEAKDNNHQIPYSNILGMYCPRTYSGGFYNLFQNSQDYSTDNSYSYYLQFDFCNRKIILTGYYIRTDSSWNFSPKEWKVEGSNDNSQYNIITEKVTSHFTVKDQEEYF